MSEARKEKWLTYILLTMGSIVVIYPFIFMVLNSFKIGTEILNYPASLPKQWSLNGYYNVFTKMDLGTMFKNTIIIAVSVTLLNVLLNVMVAYALSKLHFPGKRLIFTVLIASMMVPGILLMIPSYSMYYSWGWIDTFAVMIIPGGVSAYNIFLIRQYLISIPNDYLESAQMDGCNEYLVFLKIVVPMSKPVLSTVAILAFIASWNDLASPLLYLHDKSMYTLQIGIYSIKTIIPGEFLEQLWAALTISTVPVIIVFFFLQRYFIQAFTGAGIK